MTLQPLRQETVRLLKSTQVITSIYSIIKELIENSLDAGATSIFIKLENCGFDRLEVRDNGSGIKEEDMEFVAKPHYTSKITSFADLASLCTYGFRGEALSSLCNVSDVTVTTKTKDMVVCYTYQFDHSGVVVEKKALAGNEGTTVIVKNLFKDLPVRRQFFGNVCKRKEELKKAENLALAFSVAVPKLRLSFMSDKSVIVQKFSSVDVYGSIRCIFPTLAKMMTTRTRCDGAIRVETVLPENASISTLGRSTSEHLFIVVNEKPVIHKQFVKMIKSYFSGQMPVSHGRYPIGVVTISVPCANMDVNLEPNKDRVLLSDEKTIMKLLQKILTELYGTLEGKVIIGDECEELNASEMTCSLADPSQINAVHKSFDILVESDDFTKKQLIIPENVAPEKIIGVSRYNKIGEKDTIEQQNIPIEMMPVFGEKVQKIVSITDEQNSNFFKGIINLLPMGKEIFTNHNAVDVSDAEKSLNESVLPVESPFLTSLRFNSTGSGLNITNCSLGLPSNVDAETQLEILDKSKQMESKPIEQNNSILKEIESDNFTFWSEDDDWQNIDDSFQSDDSLQKMNNDCLGIADKLQSSKLITTEEKGFCQSEKTFIPRLESDDHKRNWALGRVEVNGENIQPVQLLTTGNATSTALKRLHPPSDDDTPVKRKSNVVGVSTVSYETVRGGQLKKPSSAFIIFCRDIRPEVLAANPGTDFSFVAQAMANRWKALNIDEKERYQEMARDDMARYQHVSRTSKGSPSVKDVTNISAKSTLDRFVTPSTSSNARLLSGRFLHKVNRVQRKVHEIEVTITDVKEKLMRSIESHEDDWSKFSLIGRMGQVTSGWLCVDNGAICALNTTRMHEAILLESLISTLVVPWQRLEEPIPFNSSSFGYANWDTLVNLPQEEILGGLTHYRVKDPRVTCNGFEVHLYHGSCGSPVIAYGELVGISDSVAFYGLRDLQELLSKLTPSATVASARPLKILFWIKGEVIRMTRSAPNIVDRDDLLEKLVRWHQPGTGVETPKQCIHNKDILSPLFSLEHLPSSAPENSLSRIEEYCSLDMVEL